MSKEREIIEQIDNYVEMFNSVCKQVSGHLLNKFPNNRNIHIYGDIVNDVMKKKPKEPISIFVRDIYSNDKYRDSILERNETFFRHNDHKDLTTKDESGSEVLFQFQSCWDDLNKESRNFIKEAMKTLINLCDVYIEQFDELNKLKKKN
jgi:hypothetical protein